MNDTKKAAAELYDALILLKSAKTNLRRAKSDQHVPLAVQIAALEEIYDLLTDEECTPEIAEEGEKT